MRKAISMLAATVSAAFLAFASLILFVGTGIQTVHAAATTYNLTPLGTLGGPTIARGVNESGEVVGQSQSPSGLRAFFWNGGTTPEDLGTLGGPTSAGRGINDDGLADGHGLAVGFSRISPLNNQQRGFVTEEHAECEKSMADLGTLDPEDLPKFTSSEAQAINESGQIVGRSYSSSASGRAFLSQKLRCGVGPMKDLGVLVPGKDTYSEAWAINDEGEVVGESGVHEDQGKAFLYSEGAMKPLGTLDGQDYSEAMGINNSGQVVGWSYTSRANVQGRAFLYENGEMKDLKTLGEDLYSMARAIDEHGRVVGQSRDRSGGPGVQVKNRAFLWEDGQMTDLNSLISPDDPDHPANTPDPGEPDYDNESLKTLLDAYAIGESGMIVGSAFNKDGQVRAFLLTPNDATAPNTAADVSPEPNAAGWNREDVTITLEATDEGGSNVEGITYSASGAQEITEKKVEGELVRIPLTSEGETTITYSARDHAGNVGEPKTLTVRLDKTAPEIDIVTPADGAEYKLGETLAAGYACSDEGSGVTSCAGPIPHGDNIDTASVGQKTFVVEAADEAGNVASESHIYFVVYDFDGFFSPVDNPDVLNRVQAGSAVPAKFGLSGDRGLDIFAEGYPKSQRINCDSAAPVDNIEQTVSAGESGLAYDTATDQYSYVWKTSKAWNDTCRQLVVKLNDGTVHQANFKLK